MTTPADPDPKEPRPEEVRTSNVSARVPEHVSRGAFSTGVIVMTGGTEFVLDFIQNVGPPAQVAARVVVPHAVMPQFVEALRTNLAMYTQRFGPPPELPRPQPGQRQPTAQEIYDDLKMPDSVLSGAYANGVMISHTPSEFRLDFLTNLFPHPAVSARVYLSAPQIPRLHESLSSTWRQFQQRVQQQPPREPPGGGPPPADTPDDG
jgi:hypothetical protein